MLSLSFFQSWLGWLVGQVKDRAILRWLYFQRFTILEYWFKAAVVFSVFFFFYFGGTSSLNPNAMELQQYGFLASALAVLNQALGNTWLSAFSIKLSIISLCVTLGAVTPVMIVLSPLLLLLLPAFMFGAALWVFSLFLGLFAAALAPVGLIIGGKALAVHGAFLWLAKADERAEQERRVFAALGLGDGAGRALAGGLGAGGSIGWQGATHAARMDEEESAGFNVWSRSGILLGRAFGKPFLVDTPKHVLIVAGTRGGKGRDLIIPNLKLYEGGAFVLDPKGENAQRTAKARAAFGDVFALDPFGVSGLPTVSFNPLAKMAGDSMIADAQALADALIIGGADDYFFSAGRQLLAGVILHVVTFPDIENRDLPTVRRLLMQDLKTTLAAMATSDHETASDVLRDIGEWGLSTADDEWSGIRNSAIVALDWLASPQMAAIVKDTKQGAVDFSDYLKKPMTVYVCLPAPMFAKYNRWLRLVVSSALDAMTARLAPPPLPVRFVLDEVAQLGNLSSIESALTLSAGYGVQLWGIWQHVGDIERCYPSSGVSSWVSSAGVRMCFANNDNATCEEFSKQSGGIYTHDEIARLSPKSMLVLMDGRNPVIVQRDAMDLTEERTS